MSCPFISGAEGPSSHSVPAYDPGNLREDDEEETAVMPQPPTKMFLGNLPFMDPSFPVKGFWKASEQYGPICKLDLRHEFVILSSQKFVNEICDQDRFEKIPNDAIREIRALMGDGLFSAYPTEANWWKAHRILVPAFGVMSIRKMFPQMLDIASQMILKWDRQGKNYEINPADDLTRLALDTIGLCAFSYRFNQFYSERAHPFAQQMAKVLIESGKRANRTNIMNQIHYRGEQERQENVKKMHALCDDIIADRHRNPQPQANDLLNTMLTAKDPETGEMLSDENIRYNICTFLVAGHETTSSTLSFCYLNLLKNPETLCKAQQQVDEIVGDAVLEVKHLSKLTYLDACLKETLRISSPLNVVVVKPKEDTKIGGKYKVTKDMFLQTNLRHLHRDRVAWGEDVEVFRPERFLNGGLDKLPPNSWKPFGNGMRACIGRNFAEQEMMINMALVLQRFNIELADPTYELRLKSTLTIKPDGFRMKVHRRAGKFATVGLPGAASPQVALKQQKHNTAQREHASKEISELPILKVLYAGNMGTCKAFAEEIETNASEHGLYVDVASLDSATGNLPTFQPVIIITASYEGRPPDNARKFFSWLEQLEGDQHFNSVEYAVFGVGNSDWASTFHKIPRVVDEMMHKLGAKRLCHIGLTDVKKDPVGPFEEWQDHLWKSLKGIGVKEATENADLSVSIQANPVKKALCGEETSIGTVLSNCEIATSEIGPAKRHMEVALSGVTEYNAGDYLVVLPRNPVEAVRRALNRFDMNEDDLISVNGSKKKFLPSEPMPAAELLSTVVELSNPITRRQLDKVISYASCEQQKQLESLKDSYDNLLQKRFSVLDVLEDYPEVALPFAAYLDMLQPVSPRQYSISSSPLHYSTTNGTPNYSSSQTSRGATISLTYDIISAPSWSRPKFSPFQGVASTYLASRRPGDRISCFVRPTRAGFRLPTDPSTPVIMVAAGTGIAPMRAFLQERAAMIRTGQVKLGPCILFFGCRHPDEDFIYKNELRAWEEEGVVKVYTAFSRLEGCEKGKYVQDEIWERREEVAKLWREGGKILVCGSASGVGRSSAEVVKRIYMERKGVGEEAAEKWLDGVKEVRYVSDLFG